MKTTTRVLLINLIGALCTAAVVVSALHFTEKLDRTWRTQTRVESEKRAAMERLSTAIGYGGMIHNLKNYVLRRDEMYADEFARANARARAAKRDYVNAGRLSPKEAEALADIEDMLRAYEAALERVRGNQSSAAAVDTIARVDDAEFLSAIGDLRITLSGSNHQSTHNMNEAISEAWLTILVTGGASLLLTTGLGTYLAIHQGRHIDRHTEELERLAEQLENANRAKTNFLTNMSHEIRTPLTSILGYADLLQPACADGRDRAEQHEHIRTIKRNGEHLLRLINDILDLNKIEAGKLVIEHNELSVARTIDEVKSLLLQSAAKKNLSLDVRYATPVPRMIRTDQMRLRQILINLVSNAIKFSETGGVVLEVSYDLERNSINYTVRDTGIGMTEAQRSQLFSAFHQADASTSRRFGGTGLGLYISKRLACLLGGDIAVTSAPGRGSAFSVWIDAGLSEDEKYTVPSTRGPGGQRTSADDASPEDPHATLRGARVLYVEDGPDNQRLVAHHLRKAGVEVSLANNGVEGLESVCTNANPDAAPATPPPFDLILSDMQMPEMDGYTMVRTLRERGWSGPIIALTAHALQGERERCLENGCDDYIAKPFTKDHLLTTCGAWLESGHNRTQAA